MFYNALQIKGLSTELECEKRFIELGFIISVPYGNNARYDFIVDTGKRFFRMQAKTAIKKNKSYEIPTRNNVSTMKAVKQKPYTKEDVDFIVSIIENSLVVIPVEEISNHTRMTFRPDNSRTTLLSTKYVSDFGIEEKFLSILTPEEIPDILDPLKNLRAEQDVCPACGQPKSKYSTLCQTCISKRARERIEKIIDRETLKSKIRTMSFEKVGKDYGVTKGSVTNWCKRLGLPYLKSEINSYSDEEWAKL